MTMYITKSITADDISDDLTSVMDDLEEFGIDTRTRFPKVHEQHTRCSDIMNHLFAFQKDRGGATHTAAMRIAKEPMDADTSITLAVTAAFASTEEQRGEIERVFEQAFKFSVGTTKALLARQAPELYAALREIHDNALATVVDAGAHIPTRITSLELAARAGLTAQWIAGEEAYKVWVEVHKLHRRLLANDYVPSTGKRAKLRKYNSAELEFADLDGMRTVVLSKGAEHIWLARVAEPGKAGLLSIAEVDKLRDRTPEFNTKAERIKANAVRDAHKAAS